MADNATDQAVDFANAHAVNLARLEAGEAEKVIGFLEDLSGDLVGILEKNKLPIGKQQKLEQIVSSSNKTIAQHYDKIAAEQSAAGKQLAKVEAAASAKQVNQAITGEHFGGANVFDPVLTQHQLKALVDDQLIFGAVSKDWWAGQKVDLQDKFAKQMRQGYALGEDVDDLVRRVRGTKANGFKDGIMSVKKHEAEALVRSSVQTISNASRLESFEKMQPAVKGIEWVATLDSRTTPICRGLDGKQWDLEKNPIGHDKAFPGPIAHWNCRSTQVPVLRSWSELAGKPLVELDNETLQERVNKKLKEKGWPDDKIAKATVRARASQDGQVSNKKDFDDWLRGKPKAFQKELLGPSRHALYEAGNLKVSDLTDQKNRPLTVQQIEAAIASGNLPAETEGAEFQPLPAGAVAPFTDPDQAAGLQAAAADKLEQIVNNPQGQTVLAGFVGQVQKGEPNLSPAEVLAKAEALTAEKKAQSQKTSTLAKAKKKLVAGETMTPGQHKVFDSLSDDEAAAFMQSVQDAKKAEGSDALGELQQLMGDDGKFPKDQLKHVDKLAEQLSSEQLQQLTDLKTTKLEAWQGNQVDKLNGLLDAAEQSSDPLVEVLLEPDNAVAFAALPKEKQAQINEHNDTLKLNKQAHSTIGKLVQDEDFGLPAINAAKKQLGPDPKPWELADLAELQAADLMAQDMAKQALTAKNKTAMAKALEDLVPGLKVTDFDDPAKLHTQLIGKLDPDDIPGLHEAQKEGAKQIQLQKNKSSALAKAKKKLLAGDDPTKGQQAVIDSLDPEEKAAFDQSVGEGLGKQLIDKAKAGESTGDPFIDALLQPGDAETPKEAAAVAEAAAAKKETADVKEAAGVEKRKPLPPPKGIPHPSELKLVRTLGGSTGAQLMKNEKGEQFVVKRGNSPDHVRAEHEADELYRALGFEVPEGGLFDDGGTPVKVTKFLEGGKPLGELPAGQRARAMKRLQDGMPVDAVLGNWDVVGMSADNVMVTPDGKVWRIDNGGSMEFRAQGAKKTGTEWNEYPDELWTMRSSSDNSSTAAAYGEMSIYDVAERVKAIDWEAIDRAPISEAQKQMLRRRAEEAVRVADRALDFQRDQYKAGYTDLLAREALELRQDGTLGAVPKQLLASGVTMTDPATGQAFGQLRTKKGLRGVPAKPLVPGDVFSPKIEAAIKSVQHKAVNGNPITEGSALAKTETALADKPALVKLSKTGTAEQKLMAKQYLKSIDWLEAQKAKGGVPTPLTPDQFFKPYEPKSPAEKPKAQDTRTPLQRWQARMEAKGINTQPITDWLGSQSGNSWSPDTQAAKWYYGNQFDDPDEFYWDGNNIRTNKAEVEANWKRQAKKAGGEEKARELFRSYHALVQEVITTIDAPYIDSDRRAVLLFRTVASTGGKAASDPSQLIDARGGDVDGKVYRPKRGTTESHSIYEKVSIKGSNLTVTAVPYSRIHGLYWMERTAGAGGGSFLGDGEAEFAANTSGLPTLFSPRFKKPAQDDGSKDASTWGVPIDHLEK